MKQRLIKKIYKKTKNKCIKDYFSQELQEKHKGELSILFLKILERKFGENVCEEVVGSPKKWRKVRRYLYGLTIE